MRVISFIEDEEVIKKILQRRIMNPQVIALFACN